MKIRNVLEGIGAALLLTSYLPFLDPSNIPLYHHDLPVTKLIGGLLVDMVGIALLVTGFLVAVQYLQATIQRILIIVFTGFMLWRIADFAVKMQTDLRIAAYWNGTRLQSCVATCLVWGLLAYLFPRVAESATRAVRLVIASFAFCAIWIIPQLLHLALIRQPAQSAAPEHLTIVAESGFNQRIIWILFDELSYDQTFDHRTLGMNLPNFDLLRAESVSFSNLKPAGFGTDLIIPSLFLGQRIDQIRSTVSGDLWYKDESQRRWLAYDANATLFGVARRGGWSTGVDGWYNPYCRFLRQVLNVCFWEPIAGLPMEAYGASEEKSVLANAAVLPKAILAKLTHRTTAYPDTQLQEYLNLMAHTHQLIENDQVRFVFLHLPVPHPHGIFDRRHHTLRTGGTYLDNLVLADDTLNVLLQEISSTPSGNRTTVIVSSDHSWRIPLWRHAELWSDEEEQASGGHFDDRPVLLIHFPGQKNGNDISAPLSELLEHDIIVDMLRDQINSPKDLASFLSQLGH